MLLGTYRDVEVNRRHPLEKVLIDLVRERLVEEVDLQRLSPLDTGVLIGAHFGLPAISGELADLIHGRTEGNPFFIEEVLKAMVEQGAIYREGSGWERKEVAELEVPRSIRSVVGQRVGRLTTEAQEFLRVASVLGQQWDLELLHGASGLAEETVLNHLDAALAAQLLEERREGRRDRYAFAHALIGQALYEEIPRHRLRKLHLRVGETLERLESGRPEACGELARHFLAAGEEDRAGRYSILAGDHAAGLYAHAEAVAHYQAALEVLQDQRNDLVLSPPAWFAGPGLRLVSGRASGCGRPAGTNGRGTHLRVVGVSAVVLQTMLVDYALGVMRVGEKLGVELQFQGRHDAALVILDRTADLLQAAEDLEGLGRVTAAIGWLYTATGAVHEGARRIQEVLPVVEAQGPSAALAALYDAIAYTFFCNGRYTDYLVGAERAADLARGLEDSRLLARAEQSRAEALQMLGRVEESTRAYDLASTAQNRTPCGELLFIDPFVR